MVTRATTSFVPAKSPPREAELLVSGDGNCAYFEVSAKKNTNVDEMFYVLFSMAKLPHEMSPALHRKISPCSTGNAFHPGPSACAVSRTWMPMAWSPPSPAAPASTVTSNTSRPRSSGRARPARG